MAEHGKKARNIQQLLSIVVFVSLVVSAVGVAVLMLLAPTEESAATAGQKLRSDYVLELLQCCLGIVVMFIPGFLRRKFQVEIPSFMMIFYVLFLYGAIVLGEVRQFYYDVPHWDTMLHTLSGVMLGALGFSVITLLNKTDRVPLNLSPVFVAVFAFCFAVAFGVIWEIYEFTMDALLHTNMQKFALENGVDKIGHAAVVDRMKDLIVDALGALVASLIGYFSLKFKKGWIEKWLITAPFPNQGDDEASSAPAEDKGDVV